MVAMLMNTKMNLMRGLTGPFLTACKVLLLLAVRPYHRLPAELVALLCSVPQIDILVFDVSTGLVSMMNAVWEVSARSELDFDMNIY